MRHGVARTAGRGALMTAMPSQIPLVKNIFDARSSFTELACQAEFYMKNWLVALINNA